MTSESNELRLAQSFGELSAQLAALSEKIDDAAKHRTETSQRLASFELRLAHVERNTEVNSSGLFTWLLSNWKVVAALSFPAPFIFSAFIVGAWQLHGDAVVDFARQEIERSAENSSVLRQPIGLSFIKSPVSSGGTARYVLVAGRTEFGADCVYETMTPLFMDEIGFEKQGDFESRGRQYGERMTRSEIELVVPDGLRPGRVTVVLSMVYECDGQPYVHRTYPVAFELLDGAE